MGEGIAVWVGKMRYKRSQKDRTLPQNEEVTCCLL